MKWIFTDNKHTIMSKLKSIENVMDYESDGTIIIYGFALTESQMLELLLTDEQYFDLKKYFTLSKNMWTRDIDDEYHNVEDIKYTHMIGVIIGGCGDIHTNGCCNINLTDENKKELDEFVEKNPKFKQFEKSIYSYVQHVR